MSINPYKRMVSRVTLPESTDFNYLYENDYYSDHNGARALNFISNRRARYRRPESVFGSSIAQTARTQQGVFRRRSDRAKLTPARNH